VAKRVSKPRKQAQTSRPREDWVHQFLIVLAQTDPLVWRRIQVPAAYTFWDLHVAIQDAMGWLDCHLHEFTFVPPDRERTERVGIPGDEWVGERPCKPGWTVPVSPNVREGMPPMLYLYDFGDDWRHIVMYEGMEALDEALTYPRCLGGARRCPPEDCGGPHGYVEFLAAVADRKHPEHAALLRWAGGSFDPNDFDPSAVTFDDPQKRWSIAFAQESS
jgi:Plasmid pRiA4b ORF-3-like protein